MRLAIPVLSVAALVLAALDVWFRSASIELPATSDSAFSSYMPYLLLVVVFVQGATILYRWFQDAEQQKKLIITPPHLGDIDSTKSTPVKTSQYHATISADWALDMLAGGIVVMDLQGLICYMSPSAEKLVHVACEKAIGSPMKQIFSLEDLQGNAVIERVMETHRLHPTHPLQFGQVRLQSQNNEGIFVELNTTYVPEERVIIFIFRDVMADRKILNVLYQQASRDPLTDLMNRNSFEQCVEQLAHDTSSLARTHVLANVDLDNFKIINDTCGHQAGDELLKQVAQIFRRSIRSSDKVARIGGDEFAIFLEGCSVEKGRSILEAILIELRNFRFSRDNKIFSIGASVGLVEFMPSAHIQISQLFADADKACYNAKASGRNQVCVHAASSMMPEMSSQRVHDWSKLLKDAIREDKFILFAQPILPLRSEHRTLRQYEVLLRLPFRQTLLNPGSFLPVADRLELTTHIDRWIIRKSLEMLADCCPKTGEVEYRLMVNLSAQSVQNLDLLSFIERQLKRYGIHPRMICFEVSESVAISNFVHAKHLMNALHDLGCQLVC